jgi:hypothetical protein
MPVTASALPLFNRQTGQNCVACHAGGQFPELTPYGRMFKMTGYTIGQRISLPVSAMALASVSKVSNASKGDPSVDNGTGKNGSLIMPTASLFLGGKIADNFGAFAQITYDNYASQSEDGAYHGHSGADNIDLRYADRLVDDQRDLIFGVSVNNNPSVSDPWNTVGAWMQYVPVPSPSSSQFIDGASPYPGVGPGGGVAGVTAYAYWNRMLYAEVGGYRTANGLFRPFSAGGPPTELQGLNPYVRLALNREWGAHSWMVGLSGMNTKLPDASAGSDRLQDVMFDTQYQYLLDPHSVTAQLSYSTNKISFPAEVGPSETSKVLRSKLTYVYRAQYGGSLGTFNLTGAPATAGTTAEAFWNPVQNIRVGLQYTAYSKFSGATNNYDTFGRNASDNNSLFFYVWAAY